MSTGLAATSPKSSRSSRRATHIAYTVGVTALAVFLAGLLFVPASTKQFQASVTLLLESSADESGTVEQFEQQLASDEVVRRALQKVGPAKRSEGVFNSQYPPYSEIERVRQLLHVERLKPGASDRPRLRVTLVDAESDRAIALIEALTSDLVANEKLQSGGDIESSQVLEMLRQQEGAAHAQLQEFLNDHFLGTVARLRATLEEAAGEEARVDADVALSGVPTLAEEPTPARTDNPEWLKLKEEVNRQNEKRERMLERLTPLHPQIRVLEADIEKIQDQLDRTPRYADDVDPTDANTGNVERSSYSQPMVTLSSFPVDSVALKSDIDRYSDLQSQFVTTRENLRTAMSASAAGTTEEDLAAVHVADEPRITRSWGGTPSSTGLAMVAIIAVAFGAATVWCAGGPAVSPSVLSNAQQVRDRLGLPVVGEISTREDRPTGRKSVWQLWSRQIVRGSEIALIVFAVAFILTAILDSPFLAEAAENPLGTVSQMAQRLTELL